jgi:hypothetical protein
VDPVGIIHGALNLFTKAKDFLIYITMVTIGYSYGVDMRIKGLKGSSGRRNKFNSLKP